VTSKRSRHPAGRHPAGAHPVGADTLQEHTLIKMEREIFFLRNLFPKYEELVPHYEVNYFFPFL